MIETTGRLKRLRMIAWGEGISFLILLFVAMPMKYLADRPEMVRIVGMLHGLLFLLFLLGTLQAKIEYQWSGSRTGRVLLASVIPFGMLLFDRALGETGEKGR